MAKIGDLSLQVYVEVLAKDGIGPMNGDQQQSRQCDAIRKLLEGSLAVSQAKSDPVVPSNHGGHVTPGNPIRVCQVL